MFWNSLSDNTVDLADTSFYSEYDNVKSSTPEGYRCDVLEKSPIIFLGSCDMSGPTKPVEAVWSRILYQRFSSLHEPFPYIGLSRIHGGLSSVVRRFYSYCKSFPAPKKVFAVLPRPVTIEIPIRGVLVNVSERENYLKFIMHNGKISAAEKDICMKAVELNRALQDNHEHQLYQFEQNAAMIQLICEKHQIEFFWTPNIGAGAIDYYMRWFELFMDHNPWMLNTCVGVAEAVDFAIDQSAGVKSQQNLADIFQKPSKCSMPEQLRKNYELLKNSYPKVLDKLKTDANRI